MGVINQQALLDSIEFTDVDRVYISLAGFDIRVVKAEEGLAIDIFDHGEANDPLSSCYAFDSDLNKAECS